MNKLLLCCAAMAGMVLSLSAFADAGHGDEAPPSAAASTLEPRVTASSKAVELVGILRDDTLWLYVDRYASNEPMDGARITVTKGTARSEAKPEGPGLYSVKQQWLAQPSNNLFMAKFLVPG